jgi:HAD superfamily hydrolase (TIGR01509 family)
MLLNNIRAIFLDLDGTLVNSIEIYMKSWEEVFEKLRIKEKIDMGFGKGEPPLEVIKHYYEKYAKKHGIKYEEFVKLRNETIKKNIKDVKLNPGAKEFLDFARSRYKLALVTSSEKWVVEEIINKLNLKNYFDLIVTLDDIKNPKPSPEPYQFAMKKLNLLPNECLAIEDSVYGVISAKSAGINVIVVLTGVNDKKELKNLGVYKIFKDFRDLLKFFKENLKELEIKEKQE